VSKIDLCLQCGMPCSKPEVSTAQHGTLSGAGYLHQSLQSRGEMGVPGPRGVPGAQGPIGPAGPQGPRGDAAGLITSWESRPDRFELTPILGDGTRGVSARLLPFFEAYDASVRDDGEE
jgi:hypothetical protein